MPLDCQPGASGPPSGKVILVGASDDLSKELASMYLAAACVAGGASPGDCACSSVIVIKALSGLVPGWK